MKTIQYICDVCSNETESKKIILFPNSILKPGFDIGYSDLVGLNEVCDGCFSRIMDAMQSEVQSIRKPKPKAKSKGKRKKSTKEGL